MKLKRKTDQLKIADGIDSSVIVFAVAIVAVLAAYLYLMF